MFDCDGVLVDSEIIAAKVDAEFLTEVGYEISPRRFRAASPGCPRGTADLVEAEMGRPLPEDFFERTKEEIDRRLATELKLSPACANCSTGSTGNRAASAPTRRLERLKISLENTRL